MDLRMIPGQGIESQNRRASTMQDGVYLTNRERVSCGSRKRPDHPQTVIKFASLDKSAKVSHDTLFNPVLRHSYAISYWTIDCFDS